MNAKPQPSTRTSKARYGLTALLALSHLVAACNEQALGTADALDDAGAKASAAQALERREFYALHSEHPGFETSVIRFGRDNQPLVNGQPVGDWAVQGRQLRLSFDDNSGRRLNATLLAATANDSFSGSVERCAANGCERQVGTLLPLTRADSAASGFRLLAEFRGESWPASAVAKTVADARTAWLVRGADGLRGLDISALPTIRELVHVAPIDLDDAWNDLVLLDERWLFVASSKRGLVGFDVSDPGKVMPVANGDPSFAPDAHNLWLDETTLYIARTGRFGGVTVVDVSTPSMPLRTDDITLDSCPSVHDLWVNGSRALLSCQDDGFRLFDWSPSPPTEISSLPGRQAHSAVNIGDGRWLLSEERFGAAVEVVTQQTPHLSRVASLGFNSAAAPHELTCQGTRCWAAHYQEGLVEWDLSSDSTQPSATFPTWHGPGHAFLEGATGIFVDGTRYLVGDNQRGLLLLERIDAAAPPQLR